MAYFGGDAHAESDLANQPWLKAAVRAFQDNMYLAEDRVSETFRGIMYV